jgi:glucosamine-phosphate N-acetyltransferase
MIRELIESDLMSFKSIFHYDLNEDEILEINSSRFKNGVKTVVCLHDNKIVGTASYFIELKFLHSGGKTMHIEDVVVVQEHRELGIGKKLMSYLTNLATETGCYKIILDCGEHNIGFYEKCGFKKHEVQMRKNVIKP